MTNNNNKKQAAKMHAAKNSLRTRIREEVMLGSGSAPGTTSAVAVLNGTNTNTGGAYCLTPLGLTGAVLSAGVYTNGTIGNVDPPHLRKLNNLAIDFQSYRVLSGKFVFIPSVGVTTPGQIVLATSRDAIDGATLPQVAFATGTSSRVFNLSVGKEVSVPMDVDSSWKKVTSVLTQAGNTMPLGGTALNTTLVSFNSIADLSFSTVSWLLTNTSNTVTTNYGVFAVEYEVEFRGLIDVAVNL